MKLNRTLTICFLLAITIAFLTGCGGSAAVPQDKTVPNSVPQVFNGTKHLFFVDAAGFTDFTIDVNFTQNGTTFTGHDIGGNSPNQHPTMSCFNFTAVTFNGTLDASTFTMTFTDGQSNGKASGTLTPLGGSWALLLTNPSCGNLTQLNGTLQFQ